MKCLKDGKKPVQDLILLHSGRMGSVDTEAGARIKTLLISLIITIILC